MKEAIRKCVRFIDRCGGASLTRVAIDRSIDGTKRGRASHREHQTWFAHRCPDVCRQATLDFPVGPWLLWACSWPTPHEASWHFQPISEVRRRDVGPHSAPQRSARERDPPRAGCSTSRPAARAWGTWAHNKPRRVS